MIKILVYGVSPDLQFKSDESFDLTAQYDGSIPIRGRKLIGTGIYLSIPPGYSGHICPNFKLAIEKGVTMLNPPMLFRETDEIKLLLINHGDRPFEYKAGDVLAQLIFAPTVAVQFIRGTKGAVTRE